MSVEFVNPDGIKTLSDALAVINQINFLLRPGDPSPRQQGRRRCWQKCFTLGLKTLQKAPSASDMIAKAKNSAWSWRYLISFSSHDALYATFDYQLKVTGLSRGPKAAVAVQAAGELRSLPEASGGEYTVSVLTIPGLLTEVFWLEWKSGNGPENLFIPFATSQEDLRCGHAYSAEEFFTLAAKLAVADLRMNSKPTRTKKPADSQQPNIQTSQDSVSVETGSEPEKEDLQANSAQDIILALAKKHLAEESNQRLEAVKRRIMAEKRQQEKLASEASALKQSWQRAARTNL
jgi:hypothetical protein